MKQKRISPLFSIALALLTLMILTSDWAGTALADDPAQVGDGGDVSVAFTGCGGVAVDSINADFEKEFARLINQDRIAANRLPLKRTTDLDLAARYHAADMSVENYFEFSTFDNGVFVCNKFNRVRSYAVGTIIGPNPDAIREGIAQNVLSPTGAKAAIVLNSSPAAGVIIFDSNIREMGVGYFVQPSTTTPRPRWVVDAVQRDDIFPVIINDDSGTTDSAKVTLYVHGTQWNFITIWNDDDPKPATPSAFAANFSTGGRVDWTLKNQAGLRTVHVELIDGAGNSKLHTLTVNLTSGGGGSQPGIAGRIQTQNFRNDYSGTTVQVSTQPCASFSVSNSTTTTADGSFSFSGGQTYQCLRASRTGYLTGQVSSPPTTFGTRQLLAGDVNGDNKVDILDLALVANKYLKADPVADYNQTGTVDLADIALIALNFGRTGPLDLP